MADTEQLRVGFFAVLIATFAYLAVLIVRPFLTALSLALLLAVLLAPAQRRLASRIGERIAAVTLVALSVGATAAVGAALVAAAPTGLSDLSATLEGLSVPAAAERRVERLFGVEVPLASIAESVPRRVGELLVGDLTGLVNATTDLFLGAVLFLFVLYYLLVDGDRLVEWVGERLPLDDATTERLREDAHRTTWAVLKGHGFVAVVQGAVAGAGLLLVGLPNVLFWTFVMMVLELFPVVGVAGVLGPAALWLGLQNRLLAAAFLVVYGATAVAVVDDYLRARVVDRGSSLHSATVLVGVFGGVYAFGAIGLFYGPIVVGLFATLVRLFDERYVDG
ncbi:AI-2E family transporter [Halosimplex rubrum]|uniref:AI-2E family transporter n=1 Tax=Halosimplex rubrum TaxID=869889 RepID=A0A7D5NYM0_9EURY|nr:AI-2E family transporter [Halosimplex rubrum]QLH76526.1 AI-2E family transporter [Halosimplex rubrum]